MEPVRPPVPPFTCETALQKVRAAQEAWNSKNVDRVAAAYTVDCEWRNRAEFVRGREAIKEFLRRKWAKEQDYVLRKYLWAFTENRISVNFEYEFHDTSGQWYRAYGLENWQFDAAGYMEKRICSINEAPIQKHERRIAVDQPVENPWLEELRGGKEEARVAAATEFPFGGGNQAAYP